MSAAGGDDRKWLVERLGRSVTPQLDEETFRDWTAAEPLDAFSDTRERLIGEILVLDRLCQWPVLVEQDRRPRRGPGLELTLQRALLPARRMRALRPNDPTAVSTCLDEDTTSRLRCTVIRSIEHAPLDAISHRPEAVYPSFE